MKRLGYIIVLCVGVVLGGFAAMLWARHIIKTQIGQMVEASSKSEFLNAYVPLKLINDGKTNKAITFLETSLGTAVAIAKIRNRHRKTTTEDEEMILKAGALLDDRRRKQDTEPSSGGDSSTRADAGLEPPQK